MTIRDRLYCPNDWLPTNQEQFVILPKNSSLVRMNGKPAYDEYGFSFNPTGPWGRWDHHNTGVLCKGLYASRSLETAFLEVSMDTEEFNSPYWLILSLKTSEDLRLLDLRGEGSLAVGASRTLLSPQCPRDVSQSWSRAFHKHLWMDGLIWESAANGGDCVYLNENAEAKIEMTQRSKASAEKHREIFLKLGFKYGVVIL